MLFIDFGSLSHKRPKNCYKWEFGPFLNHFEDKNFLAVPLALKNQYLLIFWKSPHTKT